MGIDETDLLAFADANLATECMRGVDRSRQGDSRANRATSASGAVNAGGRQVEGGPEPLFLGLDVGEHRSRLPGLGAQPVAEQHDLRQARYLRQRN